MMKLPNSHRMLRPHRDDPGCVARPRGDAVACKSPAKQVVRARLGGLKRAGWAKSLTCGIERDPSRHQREPGDLEHFRNSLQACRVVPGLWPSRWPDEARRRSMVRQGWDRVNGPEAIAPRWAPSDLSFDDEERVMSARDSPLEAYA